MRIDFIRKYRKITSCKKIQSQTAPNLAPHTTSAHFNALRSNAMSLPSTAPQVRGMNRMQCEGQEYGASNKTGRNLAEQEAVIDFAASC
jgi:hypothetical protein